ncbi:MAG: uroporphyrinogen decarboxylase [Mobiluncus sp.]|uniref:uroporphyrinogen decarboxylase family protein n=1 Tax=Mobiluncus sp. TaxID=47293 RepID=UPI00258844B0|nr:uroporphyrinogen decarboxylase family protein [Mobiluncus sp.]MCI6583785.1 uroporphyrinogen decarboxylase [Mobiluncus sp.]
MDEEIEIHTGSAAANPDTPLRQAFRGERPDTIPVWFLGQSYLHTPENWADLSLSEQNAFALNPNYVIPDALAPVEQWDVDAAVCFSDVLLPLQLMGIDLRTGLGEDGEKIMPLRSPSRVDQLVNRPFPDWTAVEQIVREARAALAPDKVLIAFGAAPFVVASLLVEGIVDPGQHLQTRVFMQSQPRCWDELIRWASNLLKGFLTAQVRGGAEAVQMVDPWVRVLTEGEYACMAEPYARGIFEDFGDITKISCNLGADQLLEIIAPYVDVLGIGDNITLEDAARLAPGKVLQGNLDTDYLYADRDTLRGVVDEVLRAGRAAPSHVFNCSGGLPRDVEPDDMRWVVDYVHNAH